MLTIKELIAPLCRRAPEDIDDRCSLRELGIDSLGALDLLYKIEEITGAALPNELLERVARLPLRDIEAALHEYLPGLAME